MMEYKKGDKVLFSVSEDLLYSVMKSLVSWNCRNQCDGCEVADNCLVRSCFISAEMFIQLFDLRSNPKFDDVLDYFESRL